jgi:tRNA (cytidine56-2'-O)-methyltransferase
VNRDQALALLDKHSSLDESWRDHCQQVSAAARRLAEMIAERGHAVDVERTEVLGLIHDLGRSQGHTMRHGIEGYLLLRREGHPDESRICLAHILKGHSLEQAVRLGMLTERERLDLIEIGWQPGLLSLEEKIVVVADAMTSDAGLSSIEEKYDNARRRYGARPHHDEDEAWAKRLADELSPLLGAHPYAALKDTEDDG